jgi:hypothetical protein
MHTLAHEGSVVLGSVTASCLPSISASAEIFDPAAKNLGKVRSPEKNEYTAGTPSPGSYRKPIEEVSQDPLVCRLRLILDRISRLETLPENWDSYGSQPPTSIAASMARELIWNIIAAYDGDALDEAIPFTALPLSGEGVQVEWRGTNRAIEVEIGPEGKLSYLVMARHEGHEQSEERDNVPVEEITRLVLTVLA